MRWILALVVAGGLSLGMGRTAHAQVAVGVNPWGGFGVTVGNPYGMYSSGYYGLGNYGYGLGNYGYLPGTTMYSSGYYGVAPMTYGYSTYAYPSVYSYSSYYPAYGYGYYGGMGRYRRFGRVGGFW